MNDLEKTMVFGQGNHVYKVIKGWGKHFSSPYVDVVGVGVDHNDQVYILIRGVDPVLVFDSQGNFLKSWGRKYFTWPHSLYVGPDHSIYCTDGDHTVKKFTLDGELLMTIGKKNHHSKTGCVNAEFPNFPDYRTIKRGAEPFYFPTKTAIDNEYNIYVSDGYGNARIHKFSKEGEHLLSWGEPGNGPGQFNLPHSICVNKNIIYVADRENSRIQIFDTEGRFIDQWSCNRPTDLFIKDESLYVTEMGYPTLFLHIYIARLSIFSLEGNLISRWGSKNGCALGSFFAPHAICVDSENSIYVGEAIISSVTSLECHTLQKFQKVC